MNEQLLKIEQILLETHSGYVFLSGLGIFMIGIFLWIGGLRYLKLVCGLLGGVGGAIIGSMLASSFSIPPAATIAISAAVLAIAATLTQHIIILTAATLIFGIIFAGGYMEYAINKARETADLVTGNHSQQADYTQSPAGNNGMAFEARNPFENYESYADKTEQVNKQGQLVVKTGQYVGTFLQKIKQVIAELKPTMSENTLPLIVWCILGGIIGLVLAQILKTIIMALCCSIVGTTSVITGTIVAVIAKGTPAWSALQSHGHTLSLIFMGLIAFGWIFQIVTGGIKKKNTNTDSDSKE